MNLNLTPPSLEHRALIKIAITLCGQGISTDLIAMSNFSHLLSSQKIFETVSQNVTMIPLPSLMKEKLFVVIDAVITQKRTWILFHMNDYKFITELPIILIWTAQGTIDYKRTAEVLVKNETINLEKRYSLACNYCLEDDILDMQKKFRHLKVNTSDELLITFWSNFKEQNEYYFVGFSYESLFKLSAELFKNESLLRYFYSKLTPENANNLKMQTAEQVAKMLHCNNAVHPVNQCNDILYFLLTTMNVEQQKEFFENYTYEVLRSLLVWPRQSLFLQVAKDKFDFLSKDDYYFLLCQIIDIVHCKYSYLGETFLEFWQQSPKTYKQFVVDKYGIGWLLLRLYHTEDERNIQMILKDSSLLAKKHLIFSGIGQYICKYLVYSEKWDSIEYLIQECISSLQEMTVFKGQFAKDFAALRAGNIFTKAIQWNKFLQIVENFIIIYKKRKFIKDDNISTKKVCCKHIQKIMDCLKSCIKRL